MQPSQTWLRGEPDAAGGGEAEIETLGGVTTPLAGDASNGSRTTGPSQPLLRSAEMFCI